MIRLTMQTAADKLWELTAHGAEIDPDALACAVKAALAEACDFRTSLLIRDSIHGLERFWGVEETRRRIGSVKIEPAVAEVPEEDAFPSLRSRIVTPTRREDVLSFLRELSTVTRQSTEIFIGGSTALILAGHLSRHTEDIDVVDEVPAALRQHHDELNRLAARYGLRLTHFQSHYLPKGWRERAASIGVFGSLSAHAVSEYDVFLSKLFSSRDRDRDDLRLVAPHLDRARITELLRQDAKSLLGEQKLYQAAEKNWFILFGEPLP